jgi:tRNA U34 5-methylaminomethyl-2-thiouridine-forming methyltransferase MnmC
MHPSVGPWDEARRLYVEQPRLAERLSRPGDGPLRLYDVGLGAAANAAAALDCARALGPARRRPLELVSFEVDLAPLRLALADPEGFPFLVPFREAAEALMRSGHWEGEGVTWRLLTGDFVARLPDAPGPAHLVSFDPFSPRQCPELWSPATLERVRARCAQEGEGALLMTYSAATPTRVSLLLAGFYVGAGVGIGTKAETTVAAGTGMAGPLAPLLGPGAPRRGLSGPGPSPRPASPTS